MQTENSTLRGAQAGARGSLTGGGGPGLWPGGVRGKGGGVGGDSSLNTPSSAHLRRDRQAFSMYEPVGTTPKALTPALDPLTGRLQPLSPVSVSISGGLIFFLNFPFLLGSISPSVFLSPHWCSAAAWSTCFHSHSLLSTATLWQNRSTSCPDNTSLSRYWLSKNSVCYTTFLSIMGLLYTWYQALFCMIWL